MTESTVKEGDKLPENLFLLNADHQVVPLARCLSADGYTIILFIPYCYDHTSHEKRGSNIGTMETLIHGIQKYVNVFNERGMDVIVITRDTPIIVSNWLVDRNIKLMTYSDCSLTVSKALLGVMDLSKYLLEKKNLHLGDQYEVPLPGLLLVNSEGLVLHAFTANDPGAHACATYFLGRLQNVELNSTDLLDICSGIVMK